MTKKIIALIGVFLTLSVVVVACGGGGSGESGNGGGGEVDTSQITIGAASQGGFWYTFAGAYGNMIENQLDATNSTAVVEGGSLANIQGISQGQFQIGLTNAQNIIEALEGSGGFDEPVSGFSGIAALYPNVNHIIVREDSNIQTVSDLKGKRVSPGIKGYGGEVAFQQILELNDMSYDDLAQVEYIGTSDGANQLRDGQLDAVVTMLVTPVAVVEELDASVGVRLLPISDETVEGLQEINPAYIDYVIPKEVYGDKQDVQSIAAETVVLVDENLPDDYVYDLTQLLIENRDRWESMNAGMKEFDGEYAISHMPDRAPLHPGAKRYYEEINVLTKQETTQE